MADAFLPLLFNPKLPSAPGKVLPSDLYWQMKTEPAPNPDDSHPVRLTAQITSNYQYALPDHHDSPYNTIIADFPDATSAHAFHTALEHSISLDWWSHTNPGGLTTQQKYQTPANRDPARAASIISNSVEDAVRAHPEMRPVSPDRLKDTYLAVHPPQPVSLTPSLEPKPEHIARCVPPRARVSLKKPETIRPGELHWHIEVKPDGNRYRVTAKLQLDDGRDAPKDTSLFQKITVYTPGAGEAKIFADALRSSYAAEVDKRIQAGQDIPTYRRKTIHSALESALLSTRETAHPDTRASADLHMLHDNAYVFQHEATQHSQRELSRLYTMYFASNAERKSSPRIVNAMAALTDENHAHNKERFAQLLQVLDGYHPDDLAAIEPDSTWNKAASLKARKTHARINTGAPGGEKSR